MSSSLIGCRTAPARDPNRPLPIFSGGDLTVPAAEVHVVSSVAEIPTVLTREPSLSLVPSKYERSIFVWPPEHVGWQRLTRDASGRVIFSPEREGLYRFTTSSRVGADSVPTVSSPETLRVWVDRTPPFLELSISSVPTDAGPTRLRVEWGAHDDLPLRGEPSLLVSRDAGETWGEVHGVVGATGHLEWVAQGDLSRVHFRLEAADRVGNWSSIRRDGHGGDLAPSDPGPSVVGGPDPSASATPVRPEAGLNEGDLPEVGLPMPAGHRDGGSESTKSETDEKSATERVPVEGRSFTFRWLDGFPVAGGLALTWKLEGVAREQVTLRLHHRPAGAPDATFQERVLVGAERDRVTLPPGEYRVFLSARRGSEAPQFSPAPSEARLVRLGAVAPRVLGLEGERLRGGETRRLLFDRIDPGLVDGKIELHAIALDAEVARAAGEPTEFLLTEIDANTTSRLWRVPNVTGTYRVELRWNDPSGAERRANGPGRVTFDSSPPRVRWLTPAATAETRGRIELVFRVEHDEPPTADRVTLFSRRAAADPWTEIAFEADAFRYDEHANVYVGVDAEGWTEGEWQVAVAVEDAVGNESDRVPGPVVRIDRTPPRLSDLAVEGFAREGLPLDFLARLPAEATRVELLWRRPDHAALRVEVARDPSASGRWEPVRLPPGTGRLELTAWDASGNPARRGFDFEVEAAASSFRVTPRRVPVGALVEVRYGCRAFEIYRAAGIALEVRRDDDAATRFRQTLDTADGTFTFTPTEAGRFTVGLVLAGRKEFLSGAVPLLVDEPAAAGNGWSEESEQSGFIVQARNYALRWQRGERTETLDRMRENLVLRARERLERQADDPNGWQALASLYVFREEPDFAEAERCLSSALLGASGTKRASIFDDLAAIEAQRERFDSALAYVERALAIEKTATRYRNRARVHANLARPLDAIESYELAIESSSSTAQAAFFREEWARYLARQGALGRARGLERIRAWEAAGVIAAREANELRALFSGG